MIKIDIFKDCLWIHKISLPNTTITELIRICNSNSCDIIKGGEIIKVYGSLSYLFKCLYDISCQYDIYIH